MVGNRDIFARIHQMIEEGGQGVLAVLVETQGSTPRPSGSKMLIADNGKCVGTIGGGAFEAEVVRAARRVLKEGRPQLLEFDFQEREHQSTELICGGKIKVYLEPVEATEELVIFGAGHVGLALYQIASLLDFAITVVDDRKEFCTPARFPEAKNLLQIPFEQACKRLKLTRQSYVVIATRVHELDQVCLEQVLPTPVKYIGLLGSRPKWAQIKKRLLAKGYKPSQLRRVHCPVGLALGAVTPEEIAVSIAAELIQCRYRHTGAQSKK